MRLSRTSVDLCKPIHASEVESEVMEEAEGFWGSPGSQAEPSVTPLLPTAALSAHVLAPPASVREGEAVEEEEGARGTSGGHGGRHW